MSDDLVNRLLAKNLEECDEAVDLIEELEEKLTKAKEVKKAQQLLNYYAAEIVLHGATISRLRDLDDAWQNLRGQASLVEPKG